MDKDINAWKESCEILNKQFRATAKSRCFVYVCNISSKAFDKILGKRLSELSQLEPQGRFEQYQLMKSAIKKFRLAGGMMVVVLAALLGCGGGRLKRLPESGFQVAFESRKVASEMKSGKSVSADITVKNTSPSLGRASPTIKIALPLTLPTTGKGETQSLLTVCGCPWPET